MPEPITPTERSTPATPATSATPVAPGLSTENGGEIVARAGKYYRWTRYLMVLVLFGYGLWSVRDGFFVYPRQNAAAKAAGKDILPHPGYDVPFNQAFGVILPPLAILYLIYMLRKSRGEYRLSDNRLYAPGHPPVPFDSITALDQRQWERKGIAYISYEVNGRSGRIMLDDFVYERDPIDAIYNAVRDYVAPPEPSPPGFPVEPDEPSSPAAEKSAPGETKSPEM